MRELCTAMAMIGRRWACELDRHGAGIVVTRAENFPEAADPFAGLAGEHVIGIWAAMEIERLLRRGRPVAWQAMALPTAYWQPRFIVEPFDEVETSRFGRLLSDTFSQVFRPSICSWIGDPVLSEEPR
jgi:hypothetical protein